MGRPTAGANVRAGSRVSACLIYLITPFKVRTAQIKINTAAMKRRLIFISNSYELLLWTGREVESMSWLAGNGEYYLMLCLSNLFYFSPGTHYGGIGAMEGRGGQRGDAWRRGETWARTDQASFRTRNVNLRRKTAILERHITGPSVDP